MKGVDWFRDFEAPISSSTHRAERGDISSPTEQTVIPICFTAAPAEIVRLS